MSENGNTLSASITPPPLTAEPALPRVTVGTYHKFMASIPTIKTSDELDRIIKQNPILLTLVRHFQDNIDAACQANMKGRTLAQVGDNGEDKPKILLPGAGPTVKIIGLTREHALTMAFEIVIATYHLLDAQLQADVAAAAQFIEAHGPITFGT